MEDLIHRNVNKVFFGQHDRDRYHAEIQFCILPK